MIGLMTYGDTLQDYNSTKQVILIAVQQFITAGAHYDLAFDPITDRALLISRWKERPGSQLQQIAQQRFDRGCVDPLCPKNMQTGRGNLLEMRNFYKERAVTQGDMTHFNKLHEDIPTDTIYISSRRVTVSCIWTPHSGLPAIRQRLFCCATGAGGGGGGVHTACAPRAPF